MVMQVGWGVIGLGQYADRHIIPAIMQSSNGKLIATCHYRKEKAQFYAQRNGALRSYTTLEEMVADPEIQAVAICTPVYQHAAQGIICAKAGKHVWVEIPFEATVEAAKALVDACREAKVKLAAGQQHRFHPAHMQMKRMIDSGEIGKVAFIEARFSLPSEGGYIGGQTYWRIPPRPEIEYSLRTWTEDPKKRGGNAVTHLNFCLDTIRYLMSPREVKQVVSLTDVAGDPQGRDHKVAALLNFEGDTYAFAFNSHENKYGDCSIVVYGTEGRLSGIGTLSLGTRGELQILKVRGTRGLAGDIQQKAFPFNTLTGLHYEGERSVTTIEFPGANMFVDEIESFNRVIEEGGEPVCSGMDGLRCRELCSAILQSSIEKRMIEF